MTSQSPVTMMAFSSAVWKPYLNMAACFLLLTSLMGRMFSTIWKANNSVQCCVHIFLHTISNWFLFWISIARLNMKLYFLSRSSADWPLWSSPWLTQLAFFLIIFLNPLSCWISDANHTFNRCEQKVFTYFNPAHILPGGSCIPFATI